MLNKLPECEFFEDFYIWFNLKKKEEYYSTPLYFYNTNQNINYDNNTRTLSLVKNRDKKFANDIALKHPAHISYPVVQKYGTYLLDLLNIDLSSFETAYNTFFYKYGFEILFGLNNNFKLLGRYENDKKLLKVLNEIYLEVKDELHIIKSELTDIINYTFNLIKEEKLEDILPSQRFFVYTLKYKKKIFTYMNSFETISEKRFKESMELKEYSEQDLLKRVKEGNEILHITDIYKSNNLISIAFVSLSEILKANVLIKKCINCGMYFIPNTRNDEVYCDFPKENGKLCNKEGALATYTEKLKQNKGLGEYRRLYQQKSVAVGRNKDNIEMIEEFNNWRKEAKQKVKEFKRGNISESELIKWLNKNS